MRLFFGSGSACKPAVFRDEADTVGFYHHSCLRRLKSYARQVWSFRKSRFVVFLHLVKIDTNLCLVFVIRRTFVLQMRV